jgi:hypothetical protein
MWVFLMSSRRSWLIDNPESLIFLNKKMSVSYLEDALESVRLDVVNPVRFIGSKVEG